MNATHDVAEAARSVVVRVSSPVPAGMGPGHVSFAASFGGKRWSLAAFCTGREDHRRASVVFVSEPATSDE